MLTIAGSKVYYCRSKVDYFVSKVDYCGSMVDYCGSKVDYCGSKFDYCGVKNYYCMVKPDYCIVKRRLLHCQKLTIAGSKHDIILVSTLISMYMCIFSAIHHQIMKIYIFFNERIPTST